VFFAGQCLWLLVCAAAAVRSVHNPIKRRRDYVATNWDIFLIRFSLEIVFYVIWRHYSLNDFLALIGQTWRVPFAGSGGPVAVFFLGFGADSLIGVVSHWNKLPTGLRSWIQERIPQVPQQIVAEVETKTTITPVATDQPATETKSTTQVLGPAPPVETKDK
jgi:hypothetical protein